jgi:predicted NBD/HSP70 family sugar kinase
LAAADLRGALLARRTLPMPARRGPRPVLARVAEAAHALLADPAAAGSPLLGVAAAVPGAVDRERGVVLALAPTLGGWARVPVGPVLAGALSAPVAVENDVNLAVLGERGRGAARGHDTCVFLWIGDGIGAGVVIGGALHRGHHSLAGEVGLMCPAPELLDRRFGARGALETLAAVRALRRRWPGRRPPTTAAWAAEFLAALRARDARARRAFREAARLLGMAATNLALALDPSLIVVGGPLAGPESPLPAEIARIVSRIIPTPPRIVASALGPDAPLWGGLLTAAAEARGRLRASLRAESA